MHSVGDKTGSWASGIPTLLNFTEDWFIREMKQGCCETQMLFEGDTTDAFQYR